MSESQAEVSGPGTPYVLLHISPRGAAPGSCFAGYWVTAWHSRVPVYQIDRHEACDPVVRTLAADVGRDASAAERWLRGCAVFVTTELQHLPCAAALGTRTVYIADGLTDGPEARAALAGFDPAHLRVVRSTTPFRRDLALDDLHDAVESLAPGTLERGLSESSKCRERLSPHLQGRIADLGHGGSKIVPHAVGVDFFKCDAWDVIADVRDLSAFADGSFDTVYSSHCLEDLWHPEQALREWLRILRPNGRLVLYLPLRDFYPNVGTPGANPGHKDDYVPEDVTAMLARIAGVEVLVAERREAENSFEVVATKAIAAAPPVHLQPAPEISVLLVAERSHAAADVVADLLATAAVVRSQLGDEPHEVLVLLREHLHGDDRAAVYDLAARWPECRVILDLLPLAWPARVRRLASEARGRYLLALQPGAVPLPGALPALLARARRDDADLVRPSLCSFDGHPRAHDAEPGACVLLRRACLDGDVAAATPYLTAEWWNALAEDLDALGRRVCDVDEAVVMAPGRGGRHPGAGGVVRHEFDRGLRARGVPGTAMLRQPEMREEVLLCILKTLGDCVLALPVVDELAARHPEMRLTVVTEEPYAWIFASHPAVREVLAVPVCDVQPYTLHEEACLQGILSERAFDRVVILSDRLDNATYHHSGTDLRSFYAWQAGVPQAGSRQPCLHLSEAARARAACALHDRGVRGPYAVLHTQPGWLEKRPPQSIFAALATRLLARGLTPVLVGGPGESLAVDGVVGLAGSLSQEESAAVIAAARVFCGGDSGPLHIASAFDVPTLALYAGSGIRVAPPTATHAVAIQASGTCAVACGVSPCHEARPCRETLAVDHVLPRLDELLDRVASSPPEHAAVREWLGGRPAAYRAGPEGAVLLHLPAGDDPCQSACAGRGSAFAPADVPAPSLPARPAGARSTPAPVIATSGPTRATVEALAAAAATATSDQARDAAVCALDRELGRVLDVLPDSDALIALRACVHRASRTGRWQQAVRYVGVLVARAGRLVHGVGGRRRPAYRPWTEQYLRAFLTPLASAGGFLALLEQAAAIFAEAMGQPLAPDLVVALMAAAPGDVVAGEVPQLRAALAASTLDDDHRARALAAIGALDEAEAVVDRMLLAAAEEERHGLLLRRALLRTRAGHADAALEDVRALQAVLPDDAGDLGEVLGRLQAWLGRQQRAVLTPLPGRPTGPAAPVSKPGCGIPC
ncbi:MAG: glycosyltransferase family 9 protein [Planctomycetota bacterium]